MRKSGMSNDEVEGGRIFGEGGLKNSVFSVQYSVGVIRLGRTFKILSIGDHLQSLPPRESVAETPSEASNIKGDH